jgi:hypothetical protein
MIVSASYRTDIPALYGTWFINRLRAGFCMVTNPYNRRPMRVSLAPADVQGIVFWTRNIGPLLAHLDEVRDRGFPFVVLYTICGYARPLDRHVIPAERALEHAHELALRFGPRVCVWRYDPIVFSSLTPASFHVDNFSRLAGALRGATDEVVISFAQFYAKSIRNMNAAAREGGFTWSDPSDAAKRKLARQLLPAARDAGMTLSICAQRQYLVEGAADARCIDAARLSDVAGRPIVAAGRGHRPAQCACVASRDIGAYNTCPQGCAYCYAVAGVESARRNLRRHDPAGDFLLPPLR